MRFTDKVAFITGGAMGIGRVYARALAAEGAAVVIADIDTQGAQEAVADLEASGAKALAITCDVANETQVQEAVASAVQHFGGIDILVNNAAKHLLNWNRPVTQLPPDMWRTLLDVNVIGVVNCAAAVRPSMRERGGGVIVNQSSIAGYMSIASYGISKLAVRGLTVALSHELAEDNIRVVGIAPGATESESALAALPASRFDYFMNQQLIKRREQMEDLVGPLLFLCSDDAAFITGETILVSGGFPLRV